MRDVLSTAKLNCVDLPSKYSDKVVALKCSVFRGNFHLLNVPVAIPPSIVELDIACSVRDWNKLSKGLPNLASVFLRESRRQSARWHINFPPTLKKFRTEHSLTEEELAKVPSCIEHLEFDCLLHDGKFTRPNGDMSCLVNLQVLKFDTNVRDLNLPTCINRLTNRRLHVRGTSSKFPNLERLVCCNASGTFPALSYISIVEIPPSGVLDFPKSCDVVIRESRERAPFKCPWMSYVGGVIDLNAGSDNEEDAEQHYSDLMDLVRGNCHTMKLNYVARNWSTCVTDLLGMFTNVTELHLNIMRLSFTLPPTVKKINVVAAAEDAYIKVEHLLDSVTYRKKFFVRYEGNGGAKRIIRQNERISNKMHGVTDVTEYYEGFMSKSFCISKAKEWEAKGKSYKFHFYNMGRATSTISTGMIVTKH